MKQLITRVCAECNKDFLYHGYKRSDKYHGGHFCSVNCRVDSTRSKSRQLTIVCKGCGKEAPNTLNGVKNGVRKFCSRRCHWRTMKGKVPWNKGKKGIMPTPWNKGIAHPKVSGALNVNWKGGVTPLNEKIRKSVEYKVWRRAVFERDDYTCQFCGERGGKLNADHIKSFADYPELRFELDNGRTLCVPCHKKTKTWGRQTPLLAPTPLYQMNLETI